MWHRSALPLATEETQEVAPQIEIETNLADASANRRTKQEQRPSLFGLCLARRRKTEGQNEIENQIHQLRLIKYKIETNNYGKGQTGVHHCRGQRVCRCIQAELTTNRRTSEHNAKLFGFAELGRDSTMSESKLSPLCSLLPRLSIVEREGGKPKVNRAQNDARISSAEVRRKKTMSTSVATRHSQSELCSVLAAPSVRGRGGGSGAVLP